MIIRVVLGRFVAVLGTDARVRGTHALFSAESVRHGERGRYPAVRIHRSGGQPVHDALYRVAHVLRGGHHQRAGEQRGRGERDVHPKHGAIDGHGPALDELLEPA